MLKLAKLIFLTLALAAVPAAFAQQAQFSASPRAAIEPPRAGYRFPAMTLHYDAEWRLWKAGTASLRLEPGSNGEMEHAIGVAESSGAVAVLYRVEDRIESYFNRRNFCSDRILKHSEEGLHKRQTNLAFENGHSVLDERNLRNGETKHQVTASPACVTDALSGIFYLQAQRLSLGEYYLFPLNDGGKTVDVTAHVEGREEIKTPAGNFRTVRVAVYSNAGSLKGRGRIWVWYTDDASHLPVQARSRLFWGTMTIHLSRVEY